MDMKRHHPVLLVFKLWNIVKNFFFVFLYLFVIKMQSQSLFIVYGRYLFIGLFVFSLFYIVVKWLTQTYELDHTSFHLYEGIFNKSKRTVPFSKIQNVNRHTSFFHRLFQVTSIRFETGMTGDEAEVEFRVISQAEANEMEDYIKSRDEQLIQPLESSDDEYVDQEHEASQSNRIVHFQPTKKDLVKASFTSLSFFALIPIIGSIYSNLNDVFEVDGQVEGLVVGVMDSWFLIMLIAMVLILVSVAFGVLRTILKYGKYEISSDEERIYIKKGIIEETSFSISKSNVQAVQIIQSPLKRVLGLAEVKLTSVGLGSEEDIEVNSLYPFLPLQRAYEMISELLPYYEVTKEMSHLPKKSLWIRLIRPSWIGILSTVALAYFKPKVFGIEHSWMWLVIALFSVIILFRLFDFLNTRYILNHSFIQIKTGGFTTNLFISRREKIVEVHVRQSLLQQSLGLASIGTVNRENPVHHTTIDDVPVELANSFYEWYRNRNRTKQV
ncbi:PH domain-containing protein [Metabacillus iocasae]|uniref:Membrane protein n=1 Tax=Priestia iocasae TaxID=2291674 RepID=A0ABS2QY44_9BACI|nr:PH domain-containing protein [Metabacillus iocasae]MBM7704413.1 putative membrane protein [Metabacillus iocasae]